MVTGRPSLCASLVVIAITTTIPATGQAPEIPPLVVPHAADLMIKTRESFDRPNSTVTTTVVFVKGARQRRERIAEFPPQLGAQRIARFATITQCDTRRTIEVNPDTQLYAVVPFRDPIEDIKTRNRLVAAARQHRQTTPEGAEVVVTIDGVDTGERKSIAGYVARHLVSTTTTRPSAGASAHAGERIEDGWYIDLPPIDCRDWGQQRPAASNVLTQISGNPPDRLRVERRGIVASGFSVARTVRSVDRTQGVTFTETTELVEASQDTLDSSLFSEPDGYRPALPRVTGGFDLSKPDTLRNRVVNYWEALVSSTRSLLTF